MSDTSIPILEIPESVRRGFIEYASPLVSGDSRYDPYKPENFEFIRYALENKMVELLRAAPESERAEADAVLRILSDVREAKAPPGFLLRHFPVDETLPPTPTEPANHTTNGKSTVSELATMAIMSLIEQKPFGVSGFYNGAPIQQISPRTGQENNGASGMGSQVVFMAHTDTSFIEKPPNYFALTCLRNQEEAKTNLAFSEDILERFTADEIETLKKPIFTFASGRAMPKECPELSVTAPILTYENGHPLLRFNLAESRTTTDDIDGQAVIQKLSDVLNFATHPELDKGIVLEAGDALFFDNRRCVHARTAFTPAAEPAERRWLQRVLTEPADRQQAPPSFSMQ